MAPTKRDSRPKRSSRRAIPRQRKKKYYTQITLDNFVCPPPNAILDSEYTYIAVSGCIGDLVRRQDSGEMCGCENNCGSDCVNRNDQIECSSITCNLDGTCSNRPWLAYRVAPVKLEVRDTEGKGRGAFALETIAEGVIVKEYVGEIITNEEHLKRAETEGHMYTIKYAAGKYIDARRVGNESRFFNHSCDPNCIAEVWEVAGCYRIGIIAVRQINCGEEISFDYGDEFRIENCMCCQCQQNA